MQNYYCSLPLAAKKCKDNFKAAAAACVDSHRILRKEITQKFSERVHHYVCAYHNICLEALQTTTATVANHDASPSPRNVKKEEVFQNTLLCDVV